jgi:hypothetical protein
MPHLTAEKFKLGHYPYSRYGLFAMVGAVIIRDFPFWFVVEVIAVALLMWGVENQTTKEDSTVIEATHKSAYIFAAQAKGQSFSFQIFADSEDAARQLLMESLQQIVDELKAAVKASVRPN